MYAFRNVQPELPLQRGPAGGGASQTSIRVKTTLIYVECRYCTSNRSSRLERGGFPVSRGVNFMTSGFLYTSQLTFSFLISAFLQPKLQFLQKRQENGITWCIFVIVAMLLNISYDELSPFKSI